MFIIEDVDDLKEKEKDRIKCLITKLVVGPGELIANELENMRYIGPIREVPPRNFQPVKFSDESRWANGLAAWDLLANSSEDFIEDVNQWLTYNLGTGHSIEIIEYRELYENLFYWLLSEDILDNPEDLKKQLLALERKKRLSLLNNLGVEVMPSDIGVGISQLIPIIVGVLSKEDQSFFSIEQPELHLHPAIQVDLSDIFIYMVSKKWPSSKCRYIIETHSEHMILRILRRIRETQNNIKSKFQLYPKDLSVVIIADNEYRDDDSKIKNKVFTYTIPVDEKGHFEMNWPNGFFEERYDEYFS